MKPHSKKFLQRRKFLMVVPLLAFPFLTMIFWALGGGQGTSVQAMTADKSGLKSTLPDAQFDGQEIWDKLSLYEIAERDSVKFEQARQSDPYFDLIAFESQQQPNKDSNATDLAGQLISTFQKKEPIQIDPNEERVNKKLEELITEINRPSRTQAVNTTTRPTPIYSNDPQFTSDVDRLEKMMEMINEPTEADPEMQQIESVLDKILDIQHPERVEEKKELNSWKDKENTFNVHKVEETDNITTIESAPMPLLLIDSIAELRSLPATYSPTNAFYSLDHNADEQPIDDNAIEAVIHDTQEVLAGSTIRLRLLNDITINGRVVPKDQFVYGTCSLNEERLTIQITSIRTRNSLLPVSLSVYDLDGLEGIHIPGAITRDAAKEASDNALQNIQLMSLDPSIGAQAASAGIEAAKGLFSKKTKMVRVTIKVGYNVLLKDTKKASQSQFNF